MTRFYEQYDPPAKPAVLQMYGKTTTNNKQQGYDLLGKGKTAIIEIIVQPVKTSRRLLNTATRKKQDNGRGIHRQNATSILNHVTAGKALSV